MRALISAAGLVVGALVLLCACGPGERRELNLAEIAAEEDYAWPGFSWGMSIREVEEALGAELGGPAGAEKQPAEEMRGAASILLFPQEASAQYVALCGNTGLLSFQFYTDRLVSVDAVFRDDRTDMEDNDIAKLHAALLEQLAEQLGEYTEEDRESVVPPQRRIASHLAEWSKPVSGGSGVARVRLLRLEDAGSSQPQSVTLSVSIFDGAQREK